MARNISVKIPTASLIAQIESAIAEIDEAIVNYPALVQQFEIDNEAYKTNVAKAVSDYLANTATKIGFDYDSDIRVRHDYSGRIELSIDSELAKLPKKPEKPSSPNQNSNYGREYTTKRQLLERNLKILRMTSQEEVNASTYGAVMDII